MSTRVASIFAELGLDSSNFTGGANQVLNALNGLQSAFTALEAAGIAKLLEEAVKAELDLAEAAAEAEQNTVRLTAAVDNAGGSANTTSKELEDYALILARQNGIEDDAIIKAEALGVSFGLQGEQIKKTTKLAVDMGRYFEVDTVSEMQKLTRAFASFDGYTLLQRQLPKFNDAQKETLAKFKENNDLIGYQTYLIDQLNNAYSDMGQKINDAGTGQDNFNVEMKMFKDNLGNLLLPEVRAFYGEMTTLLKSFNDNFEAISKVYNALMGVYRVMIAITSMGLSEGSFLGLGSILGTTNPKFGPASWMDNASAGAGTGTAGIGPSASTYASASAQSIISDTVKDTTKTTKDETTKQLAIQKTYNTTSENMAQSHYTNMSSLAAQSFSNESQALMNINNTTFGEIIVAQRKGFKEQLSDWLTNQKAGTKAQGQYMQSVANFTASFYTELAKETAAFQKALGTKFNYLKAPITVSGGTTGSTSGYGSAFGNSFTIPTSYGHEGFNMGALGTASGGERVTISNGNNGGASVNIANLYIGNTSHLTRDDITGMMTTAFNQAMAK